MRYFIFILSFISCIYCYPQDNGYFNINNQYSFNNTVFPPVLANFLKTEKYGCRLTLIDGGGKKLITAPQDIVNNYGEIILNTDDVWLNRPYHSYTQKAVRLNDSLAGVIIASSSPSGTEILYYVMVDFKYNNGHGRIVPGNKTKILKTGRYKSLDMCRTFDGNYLITAQFDNNLFLFKMDDKGIVQTDSLYNPLDTDYPDVSAMVPDKRLLRKNGFGQILFSHSSDFLIYNKYKSMYINLIDSTLILFNDNMIYKIYIDKNTNRFLPLKNELLHQTTYLRNPKNLQKRVASANDISVVSPDNKLFHNISYFQPGNPFVYDNSFSKHCYNLFNMETKQFTDSFDLPKESWASVFSCNNTLLLFYNYADSNKAKCDMYEIKPNQNSFINNNKYIKTYDYHLYPYNRSGLYEYVKIKPVITYTCKASVDFQNVSDFSGGLTDFKWFIANEKGKTDTLYGKNPTVEYTKNGKYAFKIFASSKADGGYGEYYYDTIVINIPPKAKTDFAINYPVICRFHSQVFFNKSTSPLLNPLIPEKYKWYFGDGDTSSLKQPSHAYQQPGIYNVKLVYKNGFCPDSLEYKNYINVPDAPARGFKADVIQGCSPLTVIFTDTTQYGISVKEYYYKDTKQWQTITSNTFDHTFAIPGWYWVTQRNTGTGGCITRTDSVLIKISKGLTLSDSVFIHSAGFTKDSTEITVAGNTIKGGLNYTLFQSGDGVNWKKAKKNNLPFFKQPITNIPIGLAYKLTATDSCGNQSSSGNTVYPVLLSARVISDFSEAELQANPYILIKGNKTDYLLLSSYDDEPVSENSIYNINTSFTDPNFIKSNKLQKCYTIQAISKGLFSDTSLSNQKCLRYVPKIFIPNSFTPNGDGINDEFGIQGSGIEYVNLAIFNTYGQKIFESDGRSVLWDGSFLSKNCAIGLYIYKAEIVTSSKKRMSVKGNINLIR